MRDKLSPQLDKLFYKSLIKMNNILGKIRDFIVHQSFGWCKHSSQNSWSYPPASTQEKEKVSVTHEIIIWQCLSVAVGMA